MPVLMANLIKGDQVSSKVDYKDALPVNMYAVRRDILGAQGYMLGYPGLSSFATGFGPDRGGIYNERFDLHLRVSGTRLISIAADGVVTNLGEIPGTGPVTLQDFYSFNTQGIIADGKMYLYSPGAGLTQVTDVDLGTPLDGVWVDGYYFLTDGEYIYHTDITDESAIDPLKFATAEFMPDASLAVAKTQDNKVIVFGRYSIEYFINTASTEFAFRRIENRGLKLGLVATHAKCETKAGWYIAGNRKQESLGIYLVGAGDAVKVSTREIDDILAEYTEAELQTLVLETRAERDSSFVIVHLPDQTLCFNESIASQFGTNMAWSILKSSSTVQMAYRGIHGVHDPRNSKWIYGDRFNANIGRLDNFKSTQYGAQVEWILYTPFLKLETFSMDELIIETVPGFNDVDDATLAISVTQNGYTYGKEFWALYGTTGNYNSSFTVRRLGYIEDVIGFKLRGVSSARMAFAALKVFYG